MTRAAKTSTAAAVARGAFTGGGLASARQNPLFLLDKIIRALPWRPGERNEQQSGQRHASEQGPGFVDAESKRCLLDHGSKIGLDGGVRHVRRPVGKQMHVKPDGPRRRDVARDQTIAQGLGVSAGAAIE